MPKPAMVLNGGSTRGTVQRQAIIWKLQEVKYFTTKINPKILIYKPKMLIAHKMAPVTSRYVMCVTLLSEVMA